MQKHVLKCPRNASIPLTNVWFTLQWVSVLFQQLRERGTGGVVATGVILWGTVGLWFRGDADCVCGCDNQVSALNGRFCAAPCNINGQRDVATPDADSSS